MKNRKIELSLKPVSIIAAAEEIILLTKPLLKGKKVVLKNLIPENIQAVTADDNRLRQIFYNLIGNSVKFTEEGEITVSAETSEHLVIIKIKDTGIGIEKDKLETIFNSFEQGDPSIERKYGGTGIGLSITKKLVELHGGTISVNSEKGAGSEFIFTMPRSSEKAEIIDNNQLISKLYAGNSKEMESAKNEEKYELITIVTVDDEAVNQQVLKNHLSKDFNVLQFYNGNDFLNYLENSEKPDLILLDIMMPGLSGYEVCHKIREKYSISELPVVMLTAKNRIEDLAEGFKSGANDYIVKPFIKTELMARIETHINLAEKAKADAEKIVEQNEELESVKSELIEKFERERVDAERAEHYLQTLKNIMEKEKIYTEPTLTLSQLSAKTGISPHNISYTINTYLETNFFGFVNSYRIEEAKKLLEDKAFEKKNLLAISIMAGFNSKATFNTLFKKETGMTPSEFRKSREEK